MRAKIIEIGSADGFWKRIDLIEKHGNWEPESSRGGDWKSGYMYFDEPIDGMRCWYFIQIRIAPLNAGEDIKPEQPIKSIRHGHPDFYRLCEEEMDLHSRKNYDYAGDIGNPLGNFKRVSSILAQYPGLKLDPTGVSVVYLLKQLDAALFLMSNGHQAMVEGLTERWQDVSVYSKLISILLKDGTSVHEK